MYQSCVTLREAERLLQGDLIQLGDWCDKNKLTINVKKTKVMVFGSEQGTIRTGNRTRDVVVSTHCQTLHIFC